MAYLKGNQGQRESNSRSIAIYLFSFYSFLYNLKNYTSAQQLTAEAITAFLSKPNLPKLSSAQLEKNHHPLLRRNC